MARMMTAMTAMTTILGRIFRRARPRSARGGAPVPGNRVVLHLDTTGVDRFEGFSHTVAEGQALARRSHTELPEFQEHRPAPVDPAP